MYECILVPTDGSPGAKRAVEYALELAERYGADVHALYVLAPTEPARRGGGVETVTVSERDAQAVLAGVASRAREADLDVTTALARGVPHEEIVAYARELDPDLLVFGRVGQGENDPLGTVASHLLRRRRWPVLVGPA